MIELGQVERESRAAAMARHCIEREAGSDDDATKKAWGLAVSGAMAGIERNWFRVMNQTFDSATVFVGDDIGCGRGSAEAFLAGLQGVNKIDLYINSRGGCSDYALKLYHGLTGRVEVATIQGKCYSAAVTVAMAAKKIKVEKSAQFMVHLPCLFRYGNAADLRQSAEYLEKLTRKIASVLTKRTGQPVALVNKWFEFGDTYFSASDAIGVGLADELWECQPPPVGMLATAGGVNLDADKTPDEIEFWRRIDSFDVLPVKNRERFFDNLARWAFFKAKENLNES